MPHETNICMMSLTGFADVHKKLKAEAKLLDEREEQIKQREIAVVKAEAKAKTTMELLKKTVEALDDSVTMLENVSASFADRGKEAGKAVEAPKPRIPDFVGGSDEDEDDEGGDVNPQRLARKNEEWIPRGFARIPGAYHPSNVGPKSSLYPAYYNSPPPRSCGVRPPHMRVMTKGKADIDSNTTFNKASADEVGHINPKHPIRNNEARAARDLLKGLTRGAASVSGDYRPSRGYGCSGYQSGPTPPVLSSGMYHPPPTANGVYGNNPTPGDHASLPTIGPSTLPIPGDRYPLPSSMGGTRMMLPVVSESMGRGPKGCTRDVRFSDGINTIITMNGVVEEVEDAGSASVPERMLEDVFESSTSSSTPLAYARNKTGAEEEDEEGKMEDKAES